MLPRIIAVASNRSKACRYLQSSQAKPDETGKPDCSPQSGPVGSQNSPGRPVYAQARPDWPLANTDDEVEEGRRKEMSDIMDVVFIRARMQQLGKRVDTMVANAVRVGCYTMQLVKDTSERKGYLTLFLPVGGDRFQVAWEDDTDDKREFYTLLTANEDEIEGQCDVGERVSERSMETMSGRGSAMFGTTNARSTRWIMLSNNSGFVRWKSRPEVTLVLNTRGCFGGVGGGLLCCSRPLL
ncbi:hypothetical protein HOY82DRAFT_2445 [Tuber indicum]|nr:hypothetical protein HOY82DRAFT_2445 [Tuber indicum]